MSRSNMRQSLEQAFAFSLAELDLNRQGKLSQAQGKRLAEYQKMRGCGRRAAAVAFGVTALGMAALALLFDVPGIDQARPYLLLVAGVIALISLLSLVGDFLAGRDLAQGKLSVMEGKVQTWAKEIKASGSSLGTAYYIRIGRKKFQLETAQQMQALENNQTYRFYYVRNGRVPIIFSVEPMTSG